MVMVVPPWVQVIVAPWKSDSYVRLIVPYSNVLLTVCPSVVIVTLSVLDIPSNVHTTLYVPAALTVKL